MAKCSEIIKSLGLEPQRIVDDFEIKEPCGLSNLSNYGFTYLLDTIDSRALVGNRFNEMTRFLLLVADTITEDFNNPGVIVVRVREPRYVFAQIVESFYPDQEVTRRPSIHPTAIVAEDAEIADSVQIGAYSVIGKCQLSANVVIGSHVILFDDVYIKESSRIYSNCLIGTKDFSPIMSDDRPVVMHPQIGGVLIEENVEVFPATSIARGTFTNTVIQKGVKIDHHCQISHNVSIGGNTIVTTGVTICGSARIGESCWLGPNSVIREYVDISNGIFIMMGSVVTRTFSKEGIRVGGYPAQELPRLQQS